MSFFSLAFANAALGSMKIVSLVSSGRLALPAPHVDYFDGIHACRVWLDEDC
jgi:hypothetical protein